MPSVVAEIRGKHSTPVDIECYRRMLQDKIATLDSNAVFKLQIRRVLVARRNRAEGIHAVAYNTNAQNSIDILAFDNGPTGRPGIIFTPNEEAMGMVLRVLSARLHTSWEQSLKRYSNLGGLNHAGDQNKLIARASKTQDPRAFLKNALSVQRTMWHGARESFAYDIVRQLKWGGPLVDKRFLAAVMGVPLDYEFLEEYLHLAEQMGFIGYVKDNGKGRTIIEVSEYAFDLANAHIDGLNEKASSEWQNRHQEIESKLLKAEGEVEKYRKFLEDAQAKRKDIARQSSDHARQKPEPRKHFKRL